MCGEGEVGAKKEDRLAGCVARVAQTVVDGPVPVQVQSQSGSSSGHIQTCPDKLEMLKLWILFHKVDLHSVDCRHSLLLAAWEITRGHMIQDDIIMTSPPVQSQYMWLHAVHLRHVHLPAAEEPSLMPPYISPLHNF